MKGLKQDLRYGWRTLVKNPGFTAVAVLTLALGIGANSAIFSVINGVLLKPLPYREPDRLVRVFTTFPVFPEFPINAHDFLDYRDQNRVFDDFALYVRDDLQFAAADRPERLTGMRVSYGFFRLLGWQPMLGRAFMLNEELPGNERVVILSYGLWKSRFSGDPRVLGRTVNLSGRSFTVVGVMRPGLVSVGGTYHSLPHGDTVDVWWPLTLDRKNAGQRGSHYLNGIARLKPGVSRKQAHAEMNSIAERLARLYPDTNRDARIRLVPLRQAIVGKAQPLLLVLLGAVGFVLLIACVNVANLLLARAAVREREIAIRTALGAGRLRLIRQMLTECLLIAGLGGALGCLLAIWGVDTLSTVSAGKLPRVQMIGVDARLFVFTFIATILTALLFGLAPAFQISKAGGLHTCLKEGGRSSAIGLRSSRLRGVLVVAELSLVLVLLAGAGLLMRTFLNLEREVPGFNPRNVITMSLDLPQARYPNQKAAALFCRRLIERLKTQPGISEAGVSSDLPWSGYDENSDFEIIGRSDAENRGNHGRYHFVSALYFQTIGVPLVAGRWFTERDDAAAQRVIMINRSMARRYWPHEDPVGKPMKLWGDRVLVAGIVGDVKDTPASIGAEPAFYWPVEQQLFGQMCLAVRAAPNAGDILGAIRREVAALDKDLPLADVQTMDQIAAAAFAGPRLALFLVGTFAGLALLLATVGVYGVMSYSVGQRVHEIGVRMALGAHWSDVLKLVVGQGLKLAFIGVALGVASALALHSVMAGLLYGVTATDSITLTAVSLVLFAVAGIACYIPARRAAQVDPMVALRYE